MSSSRELVMYGRSTYCPYQKKARQVFEGHKLSYREIMIDKDPKATQRIIEWTGFKSVPTIIIAEPGEDLPYEDPTPLQKGASPRGIDRGSMITEPGKDDLARWLRKHGFIE